MTDSKKSFDELEADFDRKVKEEHARVNPEGTKTTAKSKADLAKSARKFKKQAAENQRKLDQSTKRKK